MARSRPIHLAMAPCGLHTQHVPRANLGTELLGTWLDGMWVCPVGAARVGAAVEVLRETGGAPDWERWQFFGRKERALAFRIWRKEQK